MRRITPFAVSFHSQETQDRGARRRNTLVRAEGGTARTVGPVLRNSTGLNWYCESPRDDTSIEELCLERF